ncbi:protein OSB2, chloroplastic-like isoform X2 [Mangifera indica]|uniref:protein OSB2, chloroplastic-like isoform X2 n=1 Tax=Mangifera indica TaxID=29780 RepID=UPI001CFACE17|nr:protein OSB2, chloroplastic-like isoform X2 [Mangifera indica]
MNSLRRAVKQIAYSQTTTKRTVLCASVTALLAQSYSTKETRNFKVAAPEVWPRPSEIPFQVKVANSVTLIGHVDSSVQFETSSDGKHWAGTVITQRASPLSPQLWIPVVFEGDLAHIAACHLKKDDHVHIAGQLMADPPSSLATHSANVQVMAHSVNFVEVSYEKGRPFSSQKLEEDPTNHSASTKNNGNSASSPWHHLLNNPELWWDYRSQKLSGLVNSRHPDFKRKDGGLALWLERASQWVLSQLDGMEFDVQTPKQKNVKEAIPKNNGNSASSHWHHILNNPELWWDYRSQKLSGLVNSRHPDFKRKDGGLALWLNRESEWVLSQLDGVEFDVQTPKQKNAKEGDKLWKDLTENPKKWWDNRLEKKNKKSPDFKHKDSGEGLWLGDAPDWVLKMLPDPVNSKKDATWGKSDTLQS